MKNILALVLFSGLFQLSALAQQIFQFEMESCSRTMRNPMAGLVAARVAGFQHCALLYLQRKAERSSSDTAKWLDNQAYHLADFLSLYQLLLTSETLSSAEQEQIKTEFRDVTLAHPCFFDEDEATTLQHVNCPQSDLTPFSIDTDWEKAFHSIYETMNNNRFPQQRDIFQRLSHHRFPSR